MIGGILGTPQSPHTLELIDAVAVACSYQRITIVPYYLRYGFL